jgi:hypothetical protein
VARDRFQLGRELTDGNDREWWKAVIERRAAFGYRPRMNQTKRRFLIVVIVTWLAIWGYVGWRGHEMTNDAGSLIDALPPGAHVPDGVLIALEAGQSYTLNAVIWGAAVPLLLLVIGWVLKPYLRERNPV